MRVTPGEFEKAYEDGVTTGISLWTAKKFYLCIEVVERFRARCRLLTLTPL